MTWTEQKIQMLKEMWGNGYSATDIAKKLGGLTRNAVIGKAHRLKLSSRPSPIKRDEDVRVKVQAPRTASASAGRKVMLRPLPVPPAPPVTRQPVVNRVTEPARRTANAVSPLKSSERQCKWPVGDPRSADFHFCGCAAHEGLPYCMEHARVAYQNVGRKQQRREDEGHVVC